MWLYAYKCLVSKVWELKNQVAVACIDVSSIGECYITVILMTSFFII